MEWIPFSFWDVGLAVGVSVQATVLAYLYHPRWKAFVMVLPIPFTFLFLSVGLPVDATNVLGLGLWALYLYGVYLLHARLGVGIVWSIGAALAMYCGLAALLAPRVPASGIVFWISLAGVSAAATAVHFVQPHRDEPGHRSPLPLWIKFPLILAIVVGLMMLKSAFRGFLTVFPLMGIFAAYEARNSLWSLCRLTPIMMLMFFSMLAGIRLSQPYLGQGGAMAVGGGVYLILLAILFRRTLFQNRKDTGKTNTRRGRCSR
ncbi:MAG: hypothetical protein JXA11_03275 [Phycisphaerae bacterium]|nr:hypothetical protein [Phycisphaerae bacterium]